MSDFTYERLKENLERLKMKNTLEILDNYLEQALKDKVNVVEIYLFGRGEKQEPPSGGKTDTNVRIPN